jgi:hypothetical protein
VGTDILSWAEVLDVESGQWIVVRNMFPADEWEREHCQAEFVSSPFRGRFYELFGLLAGVRGHQYDPRGLPEDFDLAGACDVLNELEPVEELWFHPDDVLEKLSREHHSHSYLFLQELLDFKETRSPWDREFLGNEFFESLEILNHLGNPLRVRVVFCFD